jgi:type II secretory pathway pseudopilin PulG
MSRRVQGEAGFSLIEVMFAMFVLMVGVVGLAGSIANGARRLTGTQDQLLATERAAEAAESVFKARDNRTITWAEIRNVADGGIFVDGPQDIKTAGADGLVNTSDDGALETILRPGPDGLLGTDDDVETPMYGMTREIEIRDFVGPDGVTSATLRELRVIVRYRAGSGTEEFVLTTYISAYA